MTRTRTFADVVPLAAVEPDGLLVTSCGTYVRLLECTSVLQPHAGGPAHRELLRDRLGMLAAHAPAGQGVQVIVEAEPVDADAALAGDWQEIDHAATRAHRNGDPMLGETMRRLGYGLEQTIRRSASALDGAVLRWTVVTSWRPAASGASVGESLSRLARPVTRSGVRVIPRPEHERAASESWRFRETVAGDLTTAGCEVRSLEGAEALAALARVIGAGETLDPARPHIAAPGARYATSRRRRCGIATSCSTRSPPVTGCTWDATSSGIARSMEETSSRRSCT